MIRNFPLSNNRTLLPVYDVNVILYSHLLYQEEVNDVKDFWKNYSYFDPNILNSHEHKYHFLELTQLKLNNRHFKKKINLYLNVKFNPIDHYKTLELNLLKFNSLALESSIILQRILKRAQLPPFIESVLKESEAVCNTNDIIELIKLYKVTNTDKVKYEITRKIGLTFLLSRVKNCLTFQKADKYHHYLNSLFVNQLNIHGELENGFTIYYWLNPNDRLVFFYEKKKAEQAYQDDKAKREKKGKKIYPMQKEFFAPEPTLHNNQILKFISRVKNQSSSIEDYTSVVEKIIRKNLLYPSEVFDIYGVTFVVNTEKDLYNLMGEIENFLGGTNTRKAEKKIQKAPISEFISANCGEYFKIWKAIYDITLPHERLDRIEKEINQIKQDIYIFELTLEQLLRRKVNKSELNYLTDYLDKKRKEFDLLKYRKANFENKPFDLQVEIQIQELKSYLLSKCYGSTTEHDALKTQQVLTSTLYKIFPKQIYEAYLFDLKEKFLSKYV